MTNINILKDSSLKKNDRKEKNKKDDESNIQPEKVLCNHCGRTISNGIRCLGICVADNEY
tara:strand:- start:913 stop:1092 length:180 start_codon:yes stop_codon:yes gene_type:complete